MSSFPNRSRNKITSDQAIANASKIIQARFVSRELLLEKSPVPIPGNFGLQFPTYIQNLFGPEEFVHVTRAVHAGKGLRTRPSSSRVAKTRRQWSVIWNPEYMDLYFPEPGSFMGLNPVLSDDSSGYAFGDIDVARFDYVLVESDILPLDLQRNLLGCLAIPIAALIDSGGKSIHAIVRVGAADATDYKEKVATLFKFLVKVGADPNTKNPGRLTRLPGAIREGEKSGRRRQELLFLNPAADGTPIIEL